MWADTDVAETNEEFLTIPPPDDFDVESNQVVDLLVTPGGRCVVLNIMNGAGAAVPVGGEAHNRVTSWMHRWRPAPNGPGWMWGS